MSIVTEWGIRTRAVKSRSPELQRVDAAVNQWATSGQGPKDVNMTDVQTRLKAWKSAKPIEYAMITNPVVELETELAKKGVKPAPLAGVAATGVKPAGWKLVQYDPVKHGGSVLNAGVVGPLSPAEITKVNEAMRRVKAAVEGARDAMIAISKRKNFRAPMPLEEQTYTNFFGPYDAARFEKILVNYQALVLAFTNTPNFIDVRNRTQWAHTYGGCVRRNLIIKSKKGELGLSGAVDMLIGRAFFGGGGYVKTTDDTIVTLVHEFAHGALNAVDVPDLDNTGKFLCTRRSDDPAHPDFGDSKDPFGHQCGTEADDRLLARHKPEYAVVNADSYGQFTKQLLVARKG